MRTINPDLFLVTLNESPYFNMACDEYFLDRCEAGDLGAVFRLYTWNQPSVSIGYYQSTGDIDNSLSGSRVLVRRITGGNAVVHDTDLTYSLALSKNKTGVNSGKELYRAVSDLLIQVFASLKMMVYSQTMDLLDYNRPDCFQSVSIHEICNEEGEKVIGSAQKILKNSMLQHGSIRWDRLKSGSCPDLPLLIDAFSKILGKEHQPDILKEEDRSCCSLLMQNRYSQEGWNFRK